MTNRNGIFRVSSALHSRVATLVACELRQRRPAAPGLVGRGAGARRSRRRRRWRGPRRPGGSSLARTRRREFGTVDQHDVDRLGRLADVGIG